MSDAVTAAVLSGALSLLGTVITVMAATEKQSREMKTTQAVINNELVHLRREVQTHNEFARRVPVIEEQVKVINHRIKDLEEQV